MGMRKDGCQSACFRSQGRHVSDLGTTGGTDCPRQWIKTSRFSPRTVAHQDKSCQDVTLVSGKAQTPPSPTQLSSNKQKKKEKVKKKKGGGSGRKTTFSAMFQEVLINLNLNWKSPQGSGYFYTREGRLTQGHNFKCRALNNKHIRISFCKKGSNSWASCRLV